MYLKKKEIEINPVITGICGEGLECFLSLAEIELKKKTFKNGRPTCKIIFPLMYISLYLIFG